MSKPIAWLALAGRLTSHSSSTFQRLVPLPGRHAASSQGPGLHDVDDGQLAAASETHQLAMSTTGAGSFSGLDARAAAGRMAASRHRATHKINFPEVPAPCGRLVDGGIKKAVLRKNLAIKTFSSLSILIPVTFVKE